MSPAIGEDGWVAGSRTRIPAPVLHADRVHHGILERVAFSQHLNPKNAQEARRAFIRGGLRAPPFRYNPLLEADALLRELDQAEPPRDHPAGALVGRCFDGTRLFIRALRDRTAAAFDALARRAGWYPTPDLLQLSFPEATAGPLQPMDIPATRIITRLEAALVQRGLSDWRIEADTVMSARVLVDGAKRLLRVNPRSRFRALDIERLVVHEVDVHAVRAANGARQQLSCFQTGLPGSLATEEGLAMLTEERAGLASPGVLHRQVEVVRAIHLARETGFRDLYEALCGHLEPGLAWGICLRIKRGLGRPDLPGVYAKDSVYLAGRMLLKRWLDQGGDIAHLYVGKVSINDPIDRWLAEGWVQPGPVPPTWQGTPTAPQDAQG